MISTARPLVVALGALLILPAAASAQPCVPKSNLEAIVDDSGSMTFNDPDDLRIRAMELFIDTQGNEGRTLGAIEFGTDAAPLFGPDLIGSNASAFKTALTTNLLEDNGGTDYNAAFAAAGAHNTNAAGRIFLTDGEHLAPDPYGDGHRGGPPVYVIGLGVGTPGGPSDEILKRIAAESGGLYTRADDPSQMQSSMFEINSSIACQAPPRKFSDGFTKVGQSKAHVVKIPRSIKSAQFVLSWPDADDAFTIGAFRILRKGNLVARGSKRKIRKLKVSRRKGATFTAVKVSNLVRGRLAFKVKATKLSSIGVTTELTTQVSRRAN